MVNHVPLACQKFSWWDTRNILNNGECNTIVAKISQLQLYLKLLMNPFSFQLNSLTDFIQQPPQPTHHTKAPGCIFLACVCGTAISFCWVAMINQNQRPISFIFFLVRIEVTIKFSFQICLFLLGGVTEKTMSILGKGVGVAKNKTKMFQFQFGSFENSGEAPI